MHNRYYNVPLFNGAPLAGAIAALVAVAVLLALVLS